MRRLLVSTLGGYLALAPVYWLPGLDADLLAWLKVALFGAGAALTWLTALLEGRWRLPSGALGPAGFAVFLLIAAGGLARAEPSEAAAALKDYLLTFGGFASFFLLTEVGADVDRLLLGSALGVGALCALVTSSGYLGYPDFSGPSRFDAMHLWISGFGSVRTGWADGTALYVAPLLLPFARRDGAASTALKLCACAGIVSILASQFLVSGRAGLGASIVALAIALNARGRRRALVALGLVAGLLVCANIAQVKRQLRVVRENDVAYELDDMTGGRVDQTLDALDRVLARPLLGEGVGRGWVGVHEIHNLWLRLAVESGLLTPLALLVLALHGARAAVRARGAPDSPYTSLREQAYLGGITGGILMTLFEPRMLMGSFQIAALWWAFAGVAASRALSAARAEAPAAALPEPS